MAGESNNKRIRITPTSKEAPGSPVPFVRVRTPQTGKNSEDVASTMSKDWQESNVDEEEDNSSI